MNIDEQVVEILQNHGLDFMIKKMPLKMTDEDGSEYLTPYYGLQNSKSKECINTCKEGYTVSQNEEIVRGVLLGMKNFGDKMRVVKAGAINGGRKVFFQLELKGLAKVGNDTIVQYITCLDSNDGSSGLSVGIGDKAMHCQNQFFRFYEGSNARFRHTATITEKITAIPSLIELALDKNLQQVRIYKKFLSTPLTKELANKMVHEVLGYDRVYTSAADLSNLSKRSEKLMDSLYADIKTETEAVGENVWGLFNGLTRFTTHEKKEYKKENGDMESMLLGRNYKKAMDGFEFLIAATT